MSLRTKAAFTETENQFQCVTARLKRLFVHKKYIHTVTWVSYCDVKIGFILWRENHFILRHENHFILWHESHFIMWHENHFIHSIAWKSVSYCILWHEIRFILWYEFEKSQEQQQFSNFKDHDCVSRSKSNWEVIVPRSALHNFPQIPKLLV